MCSSWANDFEKFANDIGEPPSDDHELDRIDNNGNYEKDNIRWVLRVLNQRNQRRSCFLIWAGVQIPLIEACNEFGVDYFCAHGAYRKGNEKLVIYLLNKGVSSDQLSDLAKVFENGVDARVTAFN